MKISLLINMKMPTIVGIFIFISRENFILSWVEHEKKFYNLGARSFAVRLQIPWIKFHWTVSIFTVRTCPEDSHSHCLIQVDGVKRKEPSNMRKMCRFTSSCTCAKSHPGICTPLKYSIVSNDSVCGQHSCLHMNKDTFSPSQLAD